jgi:Flp pilus assembly protein TadG
MRKMAQITSLDCRKRKINMRVRGTALLDEIGASLVELALMMPIFTVLLLGAAEFARLAYAYIEISNAARAGAAYGAQSHATASNTANIELAATNDGANLSGLSATASTSCACSSGTSITCATAATACVSPYRIIESVQVNTSASVSPLIHCPGLPTTYTLQGQAAMRVEQ